MKVIKSNPTPTQDWEVVEQWDKGKLIEVRRNKKGGKS
jgi:hypothetical protein